MPPRDPFLDALETVRQAPPPADDPFLSALATVRVTEDTDEGPSLSQQVLRTGLRVGGGILGSVAGGLAGAATMNPAGILAGGIVGGGIGSGLGELGAEWLESQPGRGHVREGINPYQVATQTAIGAIPISRAKAGLSLLQAGLRQAGKGAVLAGGANVATNLAEGENPTVFGVAGSAGLGAVLGGGIGAAVHRPGGALRTPIQPQGYLRAAPSFIAGEEGPAARFGETIPMAQAPDGSYVRGVPAEYARREVKGLLPPGPRFIAGEGGQVATLDQSGDDFLSALTAVRAGQSEVKSVPAAIAGREFSGRKVTNTIYSGDPNAADAPLIDLSPDDIHGLRWLREELDNLPFTPRTFQEGWLHRGATSRSFPVRLVRRFTTIWCKCVDRLGRGAISSEE